MYSTPSIAAFVFECDRLPGGCCSLAQWLPASQLQLPACLSSLLLQEGSGCRTQAQQGCRLPGSWLSGFVFQTGVLWKIPSMCSSVPRLLQSQSRSWHILSRSFLAAAEHLKALLPSSLPAQFSKGGGSGVGAGIFPPKEPLEEPLTGTLLPQPLLLSH